MTIKRRFYNYLWLLILSVIVPYLITVILTIFTGDRVSGMKMSVVPGVLLVHLIFGAFFIKKNLIHKTLLMILFSIFIMGLVWVFVVNQTLVKTNFDIYGFWDLSFTNFVIGVVVWELFYQINMKISK